MVESLCAQLLSVESLYTFGGYVGGALLMLVVGELLIIIYIQECTALATNINIKRTPSPPPLFL
jgi:hypothetical protein